VYRSIGFADLFFPPSCPGCGTLSDASLDFCSECAGSVAPLTDFPCCRVCGQPDESSSVCARCSESPPPFSRASSGYVHQGAIAQAIHRLKYGDAPQLAGTLSVLLVNATQEFLSQAPQVICPLPLHRRRFQRRTYDQAGLIARALATDTGRSMLYRSLHRVRPTRPQVGLCETERAFNVRGAFRADVAVRGERILLVDDVLTTGASARAAAAALLSAGASEVQVLTVARAAR
jgi:ComF family protein